MEIGGPGGKPPGLYRFRRRELLAGVCANLARLRGVTRRGCSEQSAVLAAGLRGTLTPDLDGCGRRAQLFRQHQPGRSRRESHGICLPWLIGDGNDTAQSRSRRSCHGRVYGWRPRARPCSRGLTPFSGWRPQSRPSTEALSTRVHERSCFAARPDLRLPGGG